MLNTIACYSVAELLQQIGIPVLWWIHEAEEMKVICPSFSSFVPKRCRVYAAGEHVFQLMREYGFPVHGQLNCGLRDCAETCAPGTVKAHRHLRFLLIGTISFLKGHDVLADALTRLPTEIAEKISVYLAGDVNKAPHSLLNCIHCASDFSGIRIHILGSLPRANIFKLCNEREIDCIIAPSRHDATNLSIVEGFMTGLACACSDSCGVAKYIQDGVNGFVFRANSPEALAEKIEEIVSRRAELNEIGKRGRHVYEANFSQEAFAHNAKSAVEETLKMAQK